MWRSFTLTPTGRLRLEKPPGDASAGEETGWARLEEALAAGSGGGLLALAGLRSLSHQLDATGHFWRDFADSCLAALAHAPEAGEGRLPASLPLAAATAGELHLRLPAMRGAEYATPQLFADLWDAMVEHARTAAAEAGGLREWLHQLHPALQLLGRVTFHLAENKRSPATPFAFMATYTHRLTPADKPVHLPLARALQEYAGAGKSAALQSLLGPVRKAAESSAWTRELLETRQVFQPQAWTAAQAHRLLREVPVLEAAGILVRIPDWWKGGRAPRPKVTVRLGSEAGGSVNLNNLLSFSVEATLDGVPLTPQERELLLRGGDGLVSLRGRWVEVDGERLQQVLRHWKHAAREAGPDGVSFLEAMRLLSGFRPGDEKAFPAEAAQRDWSEVVAGGALQQVLEQLADPARAAEFDPHEELQARLRPYQEVGVRWLWLLQQLGLGACLADDMGLGKTIQVIALLNRLRRENAEGLGRPDAPECSLLVAPASLLANWLSELRRFAPALRAVCLHPSESPAESWRTAAQADRLLRGQHLAITTYGQAVRLDWLARRPWRLVILDEAQAIKNPGSKQTRALKQLTARARIALSGTPVENRLGDLWSLYDFLNPGLLGDSPAFQAAMKRMEAQDPPDFTPLRRLVAPYLLRRLKTDRRILADLPEKTEVTAWCPLTKRQAVLYERSVADLNEQLQTVTEGIQRRGLVLAFLTRFKQICNHPAHWLGGGAFEPEESGKFQRLAALAEEIASRQEKVLVFTQFREMTEPLARHLATLFGRPGLVLHGGTPVGRRRDLVDQFQRDDGPPFFVLSLKAGGTGLNLTAANHVIHFDRWWNPAVENQATDRAFRLGQKRNVLVHRFVCRGTIEERIDELMQRKRDLAESVLAAGDDAGARLTELSNDELLRLVSLDIRTALPE